MMKWVLGVACTASLVAGSLFAATGTTPKPAPAPAAPPAKPPTVELRGRITGDGGLPLSRAVIRVLPDGPTAGKNDKTKKKPVTAASGADGAFVIGELTGSAFRVRIEAKGYAPLTESQIPLGATINIRMKRGFALTGVVLDRATRKPVEEATILAWEKDAEIWGEDAFRRAVSAKDGVFTVADVPAGKATVEARASGRAPTKTARLAGPAPADAPKPPPFEMLFDPVGTLTGRVTDTAGVPVAGAEVTAYWRDASATRSRSAPSDADGRFGIPAAAEVRITRMTVSARGFPPLERPGGVPSDGIVDFVLEHGGILTGEVTAADGKVPPFRVLTRREKSDDDAARGNARSADREFSDPSGAFRIEDLDPGTYTVEIQAKGFAPLKKTGVSVRPEQTADLGALKLESSTAMRGRVVYGGEQTPVGGAALRVSLVETPGVTPAPNATTLWNTTSGSDGTFSFAGLARGTYDLTAEHSAFAPVQMRVGFDPAGDTPEIVVTLYHGGSLTGTVFDGSHQPVAGVRILASLGRDSDARVADTGGDGTYFIDGLTPGTYQVSRQPRDGGPATGASLKMAAVREGETTTVDFDEGPKIAMSGVVRKGEEPLVNASIYLFAMDGSAPLRARKAVTDAAGAYQVGLDQAGRYQASVRIDAAGRPGGQNVVLLTVPDQPEVHQDIVFAMNAIVGHVGTIDGDDIRGAVILAAQAGLAGSSNLRQSTTTSASDGTFRLDAVEAGTYRITARATGYAPAEAYPVTVSAEDPEPHVDLTLDEGWLMRGRVVDPDGKPVGDATIVVAASGNSESGFLPAHTDAAGNFRITSPLDGPVNVAAISPRFAPAVRNDVEPPRGDADVAEVVLQATQGGSLRIRVQHRGGGAVAGVVPSVRPLPLYPGADIVMDRNRPKATDADGTTVVTRMYPGTYMVALVGRNDAPPVQAIVGEGTEGLAIVEVP